MSRKAIPIILFLAALAVRVAYLWHLSASPLLDPEASGVDMLFYERMGRAIAAGDLKGGGVFEMMPGFGYLLGLVYAVFGHSLTVAYGLQALLGAAGVVLIYFLAKKLAGDGVALIAGIAGVLSQSLVFHTGMLTGDTLAVVLVVAMLLVLVVALERERTVLFLVTGFIAGLGAITRGTFVLFVVLFAAWYLIAQRRHLWSRWLPHVAALVTGFVLVVAPIALRNYVVGDDFVAVSAHDGISIYFGNNPAARGGFQPLPEFSMHPGAMRKNARVIAERSVGRELKVSEVSAYWKQRSYEFVRTHPRRAFKLLGEKTLAFVNAYEISDVLSLEISKKFSWLLAYGLIPLGIILPFALFGMGAAVRRKGFTPLYLFLAANLIAVLITFVNARYRLTAVPVFLIFTGVALLWLKNNLRVWWKLLLGLAAVALCAAVVYKPLIAGESLALTAYKLANAYYRTGSAVEAEAGFKEAVRLDPSLGDAHYGLGLVYWESRRIDKAESEFTEALKLNPDSVDALNQLGNISLYRGDNANAFAFWRRSLAIEPHQPHVRQAIEFNSLPR